MEPFIKKLWEMTDSSQLAYNVLEQNLTLKLTFKKVDGDCLEDGSRVTNTKSGANPPRF